MDVASPSLPASPEYSNIFAFIADDAVDPFFKGAGTGIGSTFKFLLRYLYHTNFIFTNHHFHFFISY